MRLIIAGSRSIRSYSAVANAMVNCGLRPTEIVSGCAPGVDRLGERWAENNRISVRRFPADWKRLGKAAGLIRNNVMADYADAALILWDGSSRD